MKRLITILTLVFTMMFSSTSYAEWTEVTKSAKEKTTFYVDFERIRKYDGHVYFWRLMDYSKPDKFGDLSTKAYLQGDCILFRYKVLNDSFHTGPMGKGTISSSSDKPDEEWRSTALTPSLNLF